MSANEIVKKIETAALEIHTVSIPANPDESDEQISREQLSSALRIWGCGDERFVPSFVNSRIVKESGDELVKEVFHYGKSSMADGSPNLQRTTFRGDNLMVTEYLAGPWFMAIAGFEERQDGKLCFLLTTIRHTQHPDYVSPVRAASLAGEKNSPPTTEKNARRLLGIIRRLAENDEL
jgi:hypothetical protein